MRYIAIKLFPFFRSTNITCYYNKSKAIKWNLRRYRNVIEKSQVGGNNFEIYFEEDNFDEFASKLKESDVEYVHPVLEHSWGQRVVRFYDPDKYITEVGENMKVVCKRFLESGMTLEQVVEL